MGVMASHPELKRLLEGLFSAAGQGACNLKKEQAVISYEEDEEDEEEEKDAEGELVEDGK